MSDISSESQKSTKATIYEIHIQSLISQSIKMNARIIAKLEGLDANQIYLEAMQAAVDNTTEIGKTIVAEAKG